MKIESIIKREGGTFAEIDGIEYHFKPQADGAHVAEVKEKAHIGRFLSIADGYQVYDPEETAKEAAAPVEPEATVDPVSTETTAEPVTEGEASNLDELKKQFEAKFGRKPHHKWSAERIAAELAEAE